MQASHKPLLLRFFSNHESRNTAIAWRAAQASANSEAFTRHESRPFRDTDLSNRCLLVLKGFSLFFGRGPVYVESDDAVVGNENPIRARRGQVGWGQKSRPVAAFLRVVARHGAAMARHGWPPSPAPATRPVRFSRITRHGFYAFHETRITQHGFSLSLRRLQGEQPQARPTGFSRITNHETRITAFTLFFPRFPTISRPPPPPGKGSARRSVAAFLRVVERHGAAMARHGRPPSPAPATLPVGFSPAMRHATWVFPIPPATPGRTAPSPVNRFFTNHETRVTNHGLYSAPPPPGAGVRAPSAAAPAASGLLPLQWTRRGTQLPTPRQKRLSSVLVRVHSW